uniref:Uncharacterized protein n=1 Tax=Arundo donax TaxID=35708 RepID=A0A0A9BVI1_ARUDO
MCALFPLFPKLSRDKHGNEGQGQLIVSIFFLHLFKKYCKISNNYAPFPSLSLYLLLVYFQNTSACFM